MALPRAASAGRRVVVVVDRRRPMCGIAGFLGPAFDPVEGAAIVERMSSALRHRGPDDRGIWIDGSVGVALGHRRLAVLDVSVNGRQPMSSPSGRFVVTYNGEIYNFAELRSEEERRGTRFRGHSDTEVLVALIDRLGVANATRRLAGMFAFAVWDGQERRLDLVRDRIGEKPLYFGRVGDTWLFGSELKSLRCHPAWTGRIDPAALGLYLRYNYVPAPHSIFEQVRKVEPGTIVTIRPDGNSTSERYWDLRAVAEDGLRDPEGDVAAGVTLLEQRLRETIREEMLADVPLGAFLSGGIDSSTIVALMQSAAARPIRTFTIGFSEAGYDESGYARAVARHLGTDHVELQVTPQQALEVIPALPTIYDEPFGDSSQIPTVLVARLAREHVTVALSGDGGDELFGGYNRYLIGRRLWRVLAATPMPLRRVGSAMLTAAGPKLAERVAAAFRAGRSGPTAAGGRAQKLATVATAPTPMEMYRVFVSNWDRPNEILLRETPVDGPFDRDVGPTGASPVERMMYWDTRSYLPDDIMVKIDRAAMAVGLETRAPFLDHRVVELAWRLPLTAKVRRGTGKRALRSILDRHVPASLVDRPKMGFGVPIGSWLRGPLRDWARRLIDPARLSAQGYFDAGGVAKAWEDLEAGRLARQYPLWNLLMFQAWLEAAGSETRGSR